MTSLQLRHSGILIVRRPEALGGQQFFQTLQLGTCPGRFPQTLKEPLGQLIGTRVPFDGIERGEGPFKCAMKLDGFIVPGQQLFGLRRVTIGSQTQRVIE